MVEDLTNDNNKIMCKICSFLSDREVASQKFGWEENNTHLPAAANYLIQVKDLQPYGTRKKLIKQCPECGAYYLYLLDYEYLVNGSEDEESLIRLTNDQAEELLRE